MIVERIAVNQSLKNIMQRNFLKHSFNMNMYIKGSVYFLIAEMEKNTHNIRIWC